MRRTGMVVIRLEPGALWPAYALSGESAMPYQPAYRTLGRTIIRGKPTRTATAAKEHAAAVITRYERLLKAAKSGGQE